MPTEMYMAAKLALFKSWIEVSE